LIKFFVNNFIILGRISIEFLVEHSSYGEKKPLTSSIISSYGEKKPLTSSIISSYGEKKPLTSSIISSYGEKKP